MPVAVRCGVHIASDGRSLATPDGAPTRNRISAAQPHGASIPNDSGLRVPPFVPPLFTTISKTEHDPTAATTPVWIRTYQLVPGRLPCTQLAVRERLERHRCEALGTVALLNLYAGSKFDHRVGRKLEKLSRGAGVFAHGRKELLPPVGHSAAWRRHYGLPAQEVGRFEYRDT